MDDTISEALKFIRQHGEERAFREAGLEMERRAFAGDKAGMERMADIMMAIATLGESAEGRTFH